jgi:hypothetical protein
VWFREGQQLKTNNHIHKEFLPQSTLIASYPPPDNKGRSVVSLGVCASIFVMFFVYSAKQFGLVKPFERITFSGFLLFLSLVSNMGLLVAFWVGVVNLV